MKYPRRKYKTYTTSQIEDWHDDLIHEIGEYAAIIKAIAKDTPVLISELGEATKELDARKAATTKGT